MKRTCALHTLSRDKRQRKETGKPESHHISPLMLHAMARSTWPSRSLDGDCIKLTPKDWNRCSYQPPSLGQFSLFSRELKNLATEKTESQAANKNATFINRGTGKGRCSSCSIRFAKTVERTHSLKFSMLSNQFEMHCPMISRSHTRGSEPEELTWFTLQQ